MKGSASGKFVLRLPARLHEGLKRRARDKGVSLNTLCVRALEPIGYGNPRGAEGQSHASSLLAAIRGMLGDALMGVLLFGSVARGEPRDGSDIDLLVVVAPDLPLTRRLYRLWDERTAGRIDGRYSPHFVHLPAGPEAAGSIWFEAAVDGVVLWDDAGQVALLLRRIRRAMAEGKLVRRQAYGHPYWIRRCGEASGAE